MSIRNRKVKQKQMFPYANPYLTGNLPLKMYSIYVFDFDVKDILHAYLLII